MNLGKKYVVVGAGQIRKFLKKAKAKKKCIIFIDEIDAIGSSREKMMFQNSERSSTLNQLLVEMDGFDSTNNIIVFAATNMIKHLDRALTRSGRFDKKVFFDPPNFKEREKMYALYLKSMKLPDTLSFSVLSERSAGMTGADIANIANQAKINAIQRASVDAVLSEKDIQDAIDEVMIGREKRERMLTVEERKRVAHHEAGHALVAKLTPGTDPIHKVTIIPRGMALGLTQQLPIEDRYTMSRTNLNATIMVLLGGRAAEELVFGERTSGAGNDLERVTEIARRMVCEWGMSEEVGPITFGKGEEQIFIGKEISKPKNYSEESAIAIDKEIKSILTGNYEKAKTLLENNIDLLHKIAEVLLDVEVIDGKGLDEIVKNHKPEQYPSSLENPFTPKGSMAFRDNNIKDT